MKREFFIRDDNGGKKVFLTKVENSVQLNVEGKLFHLTESVVNEILRNYEYNNYNTKVFFGDGTITLVDLSIFFQNPYLVEEYAFIVQIGSKYSLELQADRLVTILKRLTL